MVPLASNSSEGGSPVTIQASLIQAGRLVSTVPFVTEVCEMQQTRGTWHVTRDTWQLGRCVTDQQGTFVCSRSCTRPHCSTAALQHCSTLAILASHVCRVSAADSGNGEPASIIRHPTTVLLWETGKSYIWLRTAIYMYVSKGTLAVYIMFCLAWNINYSCTLVYGVSMSTVPGFSLGDWAGG